MTTAFAELPWTVDPDALKSFLAVLCAVAHPLTNEKTRALAEREGEDVGPALACTRIQAFIPMSFSTKWEKNGAASGRETTRGWWKKNKVMKMPQEDGSTWCFLTGRPGSSSSAHLSFRGVCEED